MINEGISDTLSYPSKYVEVYGSKMHYIEVGQGDPILFLHGIPTSCYLWRNIIPHLSSLGQCIAPDLMGFGWSDKPDIDYSVSDHIKYINEFIQRLQLKKITLVMHGWGSVIGLNYAMQHEKNCKGLVFYESFLHPLNSSDVSLPLQEQLLAFNDEKSMADLIANGTSFVDRILSQDAIRHLSVEEMNNYRRPFSQAGTGKPIVAYLKELSMTDSHEKIAGIIANYSEKLVNSSLPKLLLYSVPGFITPIATVMWAKEHFKNVEIVDIGEELHLAQESCPQLIGETISVWLQGIEQAY